MNEIYVYRVRDKNILQSFINIGYFEIYSRICEWSSVPTLMGRRPITKTPKDLVVRPSTFASQLEIKI